MHRHHHDLHPQRGAELLQQLGGPGGLGTKGKVFAAEQRLGVAVLHDAVHELLRGHGADLLKLGAEVILHSQACDQGMLILGGEQTAALHFAVSGQLEGEHRRGSAVGLCPLHCSLNDGTVADVDTIEVAHGNSSAALMFQRQRRQR